MDNLGLLSSLHFPNVLLPCSPLMYSALMMASLYGCRCFMCKKNGLKRSFANGEPVSSDFSLSKCRRLDREGNSLAPLNDINTSHKCAGTQTFFSSFVPVNNFYPQPPPPPPPDSIHDMTNEDEPRCILDLDCHMARSSQAHPSVVLGGMRQPPPPPHEAESCNAPLNLTLSPSSKSNLRSQTVNHQVHCGAWSNAKDQSYVHPVDQTVSSRSPGWTSDIRAQSRISNNASDNVSRPQTQQHKVWALNHDTGPSAKNKPQSMSPRKVTSVVAVECDRDIEEHFQRSLGKDYPKCLTNKTKNSGCDGGTTEFVPPAPEQASNVPTQRTDALQTAPTSDVSENSKGNVTTSSSVDDHFAKSLGKTWTKLKSQNSQTNFNLPPQPGSVDDHFAKALGETWFQLRVKKEGT